MYATESTSSYDFNRGIFLNGAPIPHSFSTGLTLIKLDSTDCRESNPVSRYTSSSYSSYLLEFMQDMAMYSHVVGAVNVGMPSFSSSSVSSTRYSDFLSEDYRYGIIAKTSSSRVSVFSTVKRSNTVNLGNLHLRQSSEDNVHYIRIVSPYPQCK